VIRLGLLLGSGVVAALGIGLVVHQDAGVNRVALDSLPRGVTVVEARAAEYRAIRRYVGTIQPWIEAHVGPQLISAYVDSVRVRPGDLVEKGQIIATLDCRDAAASSQAVAMQARALEVERRALAHESARVAELKEGGFASANEIEKRQAETTSKGAQLLETQARMQRATLEVDDCILRAPFTGEIADREVDPGAFVRPGSAVATLVDRTTVRIVADVPEDDFGVVGKGTDVRLHALATNRKLTAKVARISPSADRATRTLHLEIDVPDEARSLPTGTTAELVVEVGTARPAAEIPLAAAAIRGSKATVFVVEGAVAHRRIYDVLGERAGAIYLSPLLGAGSRVVTEGRGALEDGDRVVAAVEPSAPPLARARPTTIFSVATTGAAP
jgi:RND family efflux transporter MFP subunit